MKSRKYKTKKNFLLKSSPHPDFPFKIGSDPEFAVTLQNKQVNASRLMTKLYKNQRTNNNGFDVGDNGNIGWDGCSSTGEMRPTAASAPLAHVNHIEKLLQDFADKTQVFNLDSRSLHASIGGHIHLEIDPDIAENSAKVDNIHRRLASFFIPAMLSDDPVSTSMRLRTGYGKITDKRIQHPGNATTYEFRVPSGEWMTTKEIAFATLAYVGTVYNEIINHPKNFDKCKQVIFKNQETALAIQSLSKSNYAFVIEAFVQKIRKMIKTFEFYPKYADAIDYILDYQHVYKDKEAVDWNILAGWKLATGKNPTKRELLSDKNLKDKAQQINLDSLTEAVFLPYNDDTNVVSFAQAIKKRVLALNWKLKNDYYLFGLKNGLTAITAYNQADKNWFGDLAQIKTVGDMHVFADTFARMAARFRLQNTTNSKRRPGIMIGLPYDLRLSENTKALVEFIADLESGKLAPQSYDSVCNRLELEMSGAVVDLYKKDDAVEIVESRDQTQALADAISENDDNDEDESTF
jgi:hypothetical protein